MSNDLEKTIACAVCGKKMASINNKHLATHQLTAQEYRARYPEHPMLSPAASARKSASAEKANAGRKGVRRSNEDLEAIRAGIARRPSRKGIAHGPMSDETKRKLSEKAIAGFADGSRRAPMQGKRVSDETKQKISASLTGRTCTEEHVKNATTARMKNNPDWAPMRGKKHSDATLHRISEASARYFAQTRGWRREHMLEKLMESNLVLLNSIEESVFRLKCLTCGHEFSRTPQCFQPSKFHVEHCDQCFPISPTSTEENEVAAYVASIVPTAKMIRSDMEILPGVRDGDNRELDIVLHEYGLAIEYGGLYCHSELAGKQRYYHRSKLESCLKAGLRLITIFEDEWKNKRRICESMLMNALNANPTKIDARKCILRKIASAEANVFLDENHIQGHGRSVERYGLFHRDELISVMTFMKGEVSRKQAGWEINRFCSKIGINVRGAAGRLFSAFIREYDPPLVTTYADLRWGDGAVYGHIGFVRTGRGIGSTPNYWYFQKTPLKRVHRFALRKTKNDPPGMTEWQARQSQGWNRIWDCGHAKWVWTNTNAASSPPQST